MSGFILTPLRWLLVISMIISLWAYGYLTMLLDSSVNLSEEESDKISFNIPKGSNLQQISLQLSSQNIISQPRIISFYARLVDQIDIKAGDYWIESSDSPRSLLEKFNQGEVIQYKVTFLEGWSFSKWIDHLISMNQFQLDTELSIDQLLQLINPKLVNPEGWFFPDTYAFTSSDTLVDILQRAHRKMQKILAVEWENRDDNLPYSSPYEALIMASIIEKETGRADERTEIAGVFVRRLERGMRLQTDPTVIYGMGADFKGDIRLKDLRRYTPYNTYMINGLPPTPIAMPGFGSISAALHPKEGSSLYFVAKGDGGHFFSDSLKEHSAAVRRFQIDERHKDYKTSP